MLYVELRNTSTVFEELPASIEDLMVENVAQLVIVFTNARQHISKKCKKNRMTRHIVDDFVAKTS
jgi:hypothetical protein